MNFCLSIPNKLNIVRNSAKLRTSHNKVFLSPNAEQAYFWISHIPVGLCTGVESRSTRSCTSLVGAGPIRGDRRSNASLGSCNLLGSSCSTRVELVRVQIHKSNIAGKILHLQNGINRDTQDVGSSEHWLTMETPADSGGYGAPTGATLAQLPSDQMNFDNFGPSAAPYLDL